MIGAHHELVVFWSLITRHVVTSVVVKVHALKIGDVAVAVRQQHVKSSVVYYEAIEINWRQWEDSLDAIRRAQRVIQHVVTHHSFTAARVAHRADLAQVKLADKLVSERRAAGGVEGVEDVEMFLDQFRTRQGAEVKHEVIYRVDSVCADRNHDITMTGQHF